MKINIRKSRKEDMPQVLALVHELAIFEKAPNEVTNTVEDMIRDGFGEQPVFKCLVAEVWQFITQSIQRGKVKGFIWMILL